MFYDESCRENQNTYFMFNNILVEPKAPQMTTKYSACALHCGKHGYMRAGKANAHAPGNPNTHTPKYVTFIVFPQQQLFHEYTSILRYTHIACLVIKFVCDRQVMVRIRDRSPQQC
jgi:hypothetical protein